MILEYHKREFQIRHHLEKFKAILLGELKKLKKINKININIFY